MPDPGPDRVGEREYFTGAFYRFVGDGRRASSGTRSQIRRVAASSIHMKPTELFPLTPEAAYLGCGSRRHRHSGGCGSDRGGVAMCDRGEQAECALYKSERQFAERKFCLHITDEADELGLAMCPRLFKYVLQMRTGCR